MYLTMSLVTFELIRNGVAITIPKVIFELILFLRAFSTPSLNNSFKMEFGFLLWCKYVFRVSTAALRTAGPTCPKLRTISFNTVSSLVSRSSLSIKGMKSTSTRKACWRTTHSGSLKRLFTDEKNAFKSKSAGSYMKKKLIERVEDEKAKYFVRQS